MIKELKMYDKNGNFNGDILYADKDNELLYDGKFENDVEKQLVISLWGDKIRFSNELGSAWATFSTTVPKLTFEGEKPVEPTKPEGITITWQPGELVLNKNSNVHVHYFDVHEEAKNGVTDFNPDHGFELTDQLQSLTHLAIGDNYENELWDWESANYASARTNRFK